MPDFDPPLRKSWICPATEWQTLDRMHTAVHLDDATSSEVVTEQRCVNCRWHENDMQTRKCLHHVMQQHQQKISLCVNKKTQQVMHSIPHTDSHITVTSAHSPLSTASNLQLLSNFSMAPPDCKWLILYHHRNLLTIYIPSTAAFLLFLALKPPLVFQPFQVTATKTFCAIIDNIRTKTTVSTQKKQSQLLFSIASSNCN